MTEDEIAAIKARHERDQALRHDWPTPPHPAHADRAALLVEVERLRAEIALLKRIADRHMHRVDPRRVAALHRQGLSDAQIGARLGVTATAVLYWRRKLELPANVKRRER